MSTAVHRSPINFGDLTPYLTYAVILRNVPGGKGEGRKGYDSTYMASNFSYGIQNLTPQLTAWLRYCTFKPRQDD
jgi:hypothetical protein